ncbi:MAG: nickel pincer cofactor biosynthesis protein LarB [Lachnospiraceae bacterium]
MDTHDILEKVKNGEISIEEAEGYLRRQPFEELGYAKIDTHRKLRLGFPEVIFCSGKANSHLLEIFKRIYEEEGEVLGTRASKEQYEYLKEEYPQVQYDEISRIIKIEKEGKKRSGLIAVCTAGTADIPVAEEAAQVAEYFGVCVERVYDVGVSGLHRLLSKLETIQKANCVIAVAGMEGALGSVIGGLVDKPVIAVPTSVGYGANMKGISALLTMINSCANGVAVVNIDNGYGAGYLAAQMNKLAVDKR